MIGGANASRRSRAAPTRACSRQAGMGRPSARARHSSWPSSGCVHLCAG